MRFYRIITGTIAAGLLSLAPVAITSPAGATAILTTATTVTTGSKLPVTYGDTITLSSDVAASDGASAYKGTVTLMVSTPSVPTWTTVATGDSTSSYFDVKPTINSAYKVVYSGYTAVNTYEDTYQASESAPFSVLVKRKVTIKTNGLALTGKVLPNYGHKKVIIKRKKGKRYVAYKKIRTNSRGQFRFRAPNQTGFKFVVIVPSDNNYYGAANPYTVI